MTTVWGSALVVAAGFGLAALGAWALTLRPRTAATRAFATYALGTGVFLALGWSALAWPDVPGLPAVNDVGALTLLPFAVVMWASLIILMLGVPRPLRRDEKRLVVRPALMGLVFVGVVLLLAAREGALDLTVSVNTGNWGASFVAIALALERFRAAEGPAAGDERRHLSLLAAALALIVGEATGRILVESDQLARYVWLAAPSTVVLLGLVAAWLRAGAVARGSAREARDVAILFAGAWLVGGAWAAWADEGAGQMGSLGVAILAGGVLLARGALVGNLLGAGVQLRWGISRSSIAAAFVAAFFLVGEGAQLVLGEANPYVGLLGAGALVFAMAPLQRAAERLAERAVPVAGQPTADPGLDKETAYRSAVRLALRDRVLTREEERHLLRLAHHAGISAPRALAIHDEIEAELAASNG